MEIGDYNNELQQIYSALDFYKSLKEKEYRDLYELKEDEYLFSKISPLRKVEERYSISHLEEIMQKSSKEKLKKINSIIMEINLKLKNKSEDIPKFEELVDKAISEVRN